MSSRCVRGVVITCRNINIQVSLVPRRTIIRRRRTRRRREVEEEEEG